MKIKRNGIGIIGYGFVGKAIRTGFRSKCPIYINDPAYPKESRDLKTIIKHCSLIFVSVPTPVTPEMKFDDTIITEVMQNLNDFCKPVDKEDRPVIVVKSAVVPSVVENWLSKMKYIKLVISPEYLSDSDGERMFVNQKLLVLGGKPDHCAFVQLRYENDSICNVCVPIAYCNAVEASLIKYMENSFLALKVTFANEFYKLYQKIFESGDPGIWNEKFMPIFHNDERMGTSHYKVPGPDGDFGFGGRCLPKDLNSIVADAKEAYGVELDLLKEVWKINTDTRELKDWLPEISK